MDSKTTKARIPYSKATRNERDEQRRSEMSNAIEKIREVLIRKKTKPESELASQENVLFAVVEWISSENLHLQFPRLIFKGTETKIEKNAQRAQLRNKKLSVAFSRMKEFVVKRGIRRWNKQRLSRPDILVEVLRLIQNEPASALPELLPLMNTKALPTESGSPVKPQMAIQPPVASLLKHSVESMLEGSSQMNLNPLPTFFPPIDQFFLQSFISNVIMLNNLVQNQMLSPVEDEKNETGSGGVVFGASNKF